MEGTLRGPDRTGVGARDLSRLLEGLMGSLGVSLTVDRPDVILDVSGVEAPNVRVVRIRCRFLDKGCREGPPSSDFFELTLELRASRFVLLRGGLLSATLVAVRSSPLRPSTSCLSDRTRRRATLKGDLLTVLPRSALVVVAYSTSRSELSVWASTPSDACCLRWWWDD